jgi:hypothetical protein
MEQSSQPFGLRLSEGLGRWWRKPPTVEQLPQGPQPCGVDLCPLCRSKTDRPLLQLLGFGLLGAWHDRSICDAK